MIRPHFARAGDVAVIAFIADRGGRVIKLIDRRYYNRDMIYERLP
ncbi:MAG: hypothetical protein WB491_04925 [Candidatus Aquilonibacter sp.]